MDEPQIVDPEHAKQTLVHKLRNAPRRSWSSLVVDPLHRTMVEMEMTEVQILKNLWSRFDLGAALQALRSVREGVVRRALRRLHLRWYHCSAAKMRALLSAAGTSREVLALVSEVVDTCAVCRAWQRPGIKAATSSKLPEAMNMIAQCDLLFYKDYVLFYMVDMTTRWTAAEVIPNRTADSILAAMDNCWIRFFGPPQALMSDQEGALATDYAAEQMSRRGINLQLVAKEQHCGVVERHNELLRRQLHLIDTQAQNEGLPIGINTLIGEAIYAKNILFTVGNTTPHEAVFGRTPPLLQVMAHDAAAPAANYEGRQRLGWPCHQIPCGFYVMLWKLNEEKLYGNRYYAEVLNAGLYVAGVCLHLQGTVGFRFGHGVNGLPATIYDDTLIVWWQRGDLRRWNHCFITGTKYISLERLTEQKQVAFVQYFMVDDEEARQLRTQVDDTPHIGGPHEPQAPELVEVKDKDLVRKRKVRAIVDAQPAPDEPGEEEQAASQNAAEAEEPDEPGSEPERGTAFVSAVPAVADFMEMPEVTNAGELQEPAELELIYGVLVYTAGSIRKLMSQMRKQDTALVLLSNDKPFAAIEREHNVLTREEALVNAEKCRESMVQELQRWIKHKSWCRTAKHGQKNILRSKWVLKWKAVENADKKIKELAEAGEDRREVALELPPGGETLLRMQPGYEDFSPEVEVLRPSCGMSGGCLVLVLTAHVDDLKLCGEDKIVKIVIAKLEDRFESMKVEKGNFTHLGLKHETSADGMVTISQEHYIRELRLIPEEELKLQPKEQLVGPDYHKYYMSLLGGVAWTTQTRMDIIVYVSALQRKLQSPVVEDLLKLNRLVRYIKQNPLKLVYHKITGPLKLMAITDSAYRGEDQDHLAVSTFTAELYSALDMVGLGLNICTMVNEITNGVQSAAHMADKIECGKITEGLDVAIDADAVFRALAAKEVKTPTDAIMLIHALSSRTAAEEGIWKIEHAFKTHQENIKQAQEHFSVQAPRAYLEMTRPAMGAAGRKGGAAMGPLAQLAAPRPQPAPCKRRVRFQEPDIIEVDSWKEETRLMYHPAGMQEEDLLEEAVELLWHYGKRVLSSRVAVAAVSAVAVTGMVALGISDELLQ
ncbi:unnamed protein product [Effrenium voratum]|nr:unnamed protein product [Effrenium voratum]